MRAIIFIMLKIAEAAVAVFVPYLVGLIHFTIINEEGVFLATWGLGFLTLIALAIFCVLFGFVVTGIIGLTKVNWKWSKKITERLKK